MRRSEVEAQERELGSRIRAIRLADDVTQAELARLASVSRSAVGSLEAGAGSTLSTLVRVLQALGRDDWLLTLEVPEVEFNPLDLLERTERPPTGRRRARGEAARPTG